MMKKILIVLSSLILFMACSKDSGTVAADCSTSKSFATDVNPIIQATCAINAGCHAAGSTNGPGALTNFAQVFSARSAIRSAVASGSMPQNGSLSSTQKNNIICWIDAGAANN